MVCSFRIKGSISMSLLNKSRKLIFPKPGVLEIVDDVSFSVIALELAIVFSLFSILKYQLLPL